MDKLAKQIKGMIELNKGYYLDVQENQYVLHRIKDVKDKETGEYKKSLAWEGYYGRLSQIVSAILTRHINANMVLALNGNIESMKAIAMETERRIKEHAEGEFAQEIKRLEMENEKTLKMLYDRA